MSDSGFRGGGGDDSMVKPRPLLPLFHLSCVAPAGYAGGGGRTSMSRGARI